MHNQKKLRWLIILTLILASLACNSITVESFFCVLTGGKWANDEPWSDSGYCDRNPPPAEEYNELDEIKIGETPPATPDGLPDESDDQVFIGSTNLGETWEQSSGPGQVIQDQIIIIIDDQNQVHGALNFIWKSETSQGIEWEETPGGPLHTCITEINVTITGEPAGELSEGNNIIEIQTSQTHGFIRFDCPAQDDTLTGTVLWRVEVSISGNMLTGTGINNDFSFIATRE